MSLKVLTSKRKFSFTNITNINVNDNDNNYNKLSKALKPSNEFNKILINFI